MADDPRASDPTAGPGSNPGWPPQPQPQWPPQPEWPPRQPQWPGPQPSPWTPQQPQWGAPAPWGSPQTPAPQSQWALSWQWPPPWQAPPSPQWPPQQPAASVAAASWPVGVVPWGYVKPPPVPTVVEPPGRFHPRFPRHLLSLVGRASPRAYLIGFLLGLPAGLVLLAYEIASRGGFELAHTPLPPWVLLELVGILASLGLIAAGFAQGSQRRADGWRDFRGPSPFLAAATQQAVVLSIALPAAALLSLVQIDRDSALGTFLIVPVYLASYFGVVWLFAVRQGAMTWHDLAHPQRLSPDLDEWTSEQVALRLGWRRPTTRLRTWLRSWPGDILLAGAVLVPVIVATGLTNLALLTILGLDSNDLGHQVPLHHSAPDLILMLLSVALFVPIGEEVFFRGYCANAWGRSLARSSAIVRAGLFFAFIHVVNTENTDLWLSLRAAAFNFGARIPVALALCWIYFRRRSIFASASLHGVYNGVVVLISFLAT